MNITIRELKSQGAQAVATGQLDVALKIYWRLVDAAPTAIEPRLKLADTLAALGNPDAALPVWVACAHHASRSGHPLTTLLVGKVLEARGADVGSLYDQMALLFSVESQQVSRYGERVAPLDEETPVAAPDLATEIPLPNLIAGASRAGADLSRVGEYPKALHRIPLLSDLSPGTFRAVIATMVAHRLPDGAKVIREGEMGASFFLVAGGQVRVFRNDALGREVELARLHEGAIFGEMAVIHAAPRTASVQVVGEADLLEVGREGLAALAVEMEGVARALDKFTRERMLNNLLATAPLFRPFSRKQRLDLVKRFTGHEVAPGTTIIREGDPGRGLYVLLSGEVDVNKRTEAGGQVLLATLKPGDVFGEIALLKGGPVTATVSAARQSTILFLDKVFFQRLVEAIPEVKQYFEDLTAERLADTHIVMADDDLIEELDEGELVLI